MSMDVEITRVGKHSLLLSSPVMPAAGTFGFGNRYLRLIKTEKLGAIVTDPISRHPRKLARGSHVVPLAGGLLMHTGLPNPGVKAILKQYTQVWDKLPVPVIAHLIDREPHDLRRVVEALRNSPNVAAVELGLHGEATGDEIYALTDAVLQATQVPLERAVETSRVVARTEAGAIVVGAPPRGRARDRLTGEIITGRIFGPLVKPLALNAVAEVVEAIKAYGIPVIGAGGIHTPEDAREFIEVGARAVQLDSVIWTRPGQAEIIARDLGGLQLTRPSDWYPDEWFPGIGDTFRKQAFSPPPDNLPD